LDTVPNDAEAVANADVQKDLDHSGGLSVSEIACFVASVDTVALILLSVYSFSP